MKTIITWLKRAAMLSVTVAFAAAGLGANAATSLTLNDGDTLTGVYEDYEITIAAGATVTFNNATVTRASDNAAVVQTLGDATIILAEGSENSVAHTQTSGYAGAGISSAAGHTLTIDGTGSLVVQGGSGAAGIGANANTGSRCGNIVIADGTIVATGGEGASAIGAGYYESKCGDITIAGGNVTAKALANTASYCPPAIGAGFVRSSCGNILICGGTVTADASDPNCDYSYDVGPAIGASASNCGSITIVDGVERIVATKGANALEIIGMGRNDYTSVGKISRLLRFDAEYSNDGNTVTLTPKASFESYTVTWKNDDGTTADTTSVEYGLLPSHAGLTKAGDGYFEYLFAGWTPEFAEVESNVVYTAVFIAVPAVRSTGGDAEWFVDADEGALRSGVIGNSQNTWLRTSLPRPCVFSFKWKTSSETGCDQLHFMVNGAYVLDTEGRQVATISGVGNDWTTVSVVISNSLDVLEWKYGKDGSAVSGQDCGWVKDFEMATFDGEIRSLSVVPNYDGLATVTAYAAKDVVMDVFPPLARHGYALLGYFTAAEGGELVEPPYALSADTTLYAHWAKTTDFDTSDPTAEWTIEDDGITWRTGAIGHSTNTWATYTVKRPCTVTYKWKTSTEANNDPLVFYVDDVEQSRISGESADWVDVSLSFEDSKNHVLKWVYSKDWSDTGRYDCGWIRDFVVTPYDSWAVTRELNYEGATELETRYVKKGRQLDVSEFPPLDGLREGYTCYWALAPWSGDALTNAVDISADTTLYAHWIKQHGFDEIDTTCQTPWTWIDDGSIRTGKIGDSGNTWATISVTGPCDISFKWMTSSETGWDKLHFYVDDSHKIEISGVTPEWESYTASVGSGDHVLKWTYTKDGGGAFGEDCGWVKDIVITAPDSAPYTVTWKNADGTTLETDADLEAGAVPVYNSALPTQAATAQYYFDFAGWEPDFELVSSNMVYTAKYTATLRSYDVTWQDENGTALDAQTLYYGTTPEYAGETPTKAATPKYTYTFAGWTPEVATVTGEATYTATYDATINEYTITWKNDDGTVIDSADVAYDETPTHADPTKASTAQYHYEFAGWSPAIASVTGEATYTATFTPILRSYTITWLNEDGTALDTSTVEYGATPSHAAPTKASTAQYDYIFAGWGNVVEVSGEATYQATFTSVLRSYTITWANIDGAGASATSTVEYGTVPAYGGETPTKAETAEYTYTFSGWSPSVASVTGPAIYTAQFNATKRSYTITWANINGEGASATSTVEYGATPTYSGETPTKAETAECTYTFSSWSPAVGTVSGDATYTAQFNATKRSYTITWVVEGETVASGAVEYGQTPTYDGETPTKASTAEYCYEFTGWSPAVAAVTGDTVYTATFNAIPKSESGTIDISTLAKGDVVQNGSVLTGTAPNLYLKIADGATITLDGASITSSEYYVGAIHCFGDATIILAPGSENTVRGAVAKYCTGNAIYVPTNSTLTIRGSGSLYADSSNSEFRSAAIGAFAYPYNSDDVFPCGDIVIEGGTIVANGGVGIGASGNGGYCSNITITGDANVTATATVNGSAGIGAAGSDGNCGNITISGNASVTATGQYYGPGIGAADHSTCGDIVISTTGMVTATGNFFAPGIGAPGAFETCKCGDITITGGTVIAAGSYHSPGIGTDYYYKRNGTCGSITIADTITMVTAQGMDDSPGIFRPEDSDPYFTCGSNLDLVKSDENRLYTLTPVVAPDTYTVTWKNDDGNTLETDVGVAYGATPVYDGETPAKAADAQYTYEFAGWTPAVAAVTGDTVYTATFTPVTRTYTVSWIVEGATVASGSVEYGQTPTYDGDTPTKESTSEYTYEFTGWSPTVATVTGAATYTAQFSQTKRSYTVSWVVEGATVASGSVEYGQTPSYGGETPTKESTAQYDYEFAGWGDVVAVTGDATYMAVFTPVTRSYNVTWVVEGETVASGAVEYGATPVYDGETPTKESTAEYSYAFTGWNPTVVSVTGDATYTAQFNATKRSYTVWWVVEGVTVASGSVEYGQTPEYGGDTPTKESTAEYSYSFTGWSPAIAAVTGDATYTAQFNATKRSYTVSWVVEGATVASGAVEYGQTPTYDGDTPTKESTAEYSYAFTGWNPTVVDVTGDATYTAQFSQTKRSYTITWVVEGASVASGTVEYGTTPVYNGATPTKPEDENYTYTFSGWTPAVVAVIGNATYTATFTATPKETEDPEEPYEGTETIDGIAWSYTVANGVATITDMSPVIGDVVIPATVTNGVPVTALKDYIENLRYDDGITSITLPASVTNIGAGNFVGCTALVAINVAEGNTAYSSADGILYDVSKTELLVSPGGKTVVTNMPESVVTIASGAFEGSRVQFCVMAQYATNIAERAFSGCSYLGSVSIEKHIRNIGAYAFENCVNVSIVNFPSDSFCEVIGVGAFSGCTKLQRVTIPDSVKVIRGGAFSGCSELFDVTIGSGVAQIGDATVPHYIDEWGDDATMDFDPAFGNCANLRDFKVSKDNAIYEAIDGCIYYRSTPNTAKTLAVYPSGRGDLHFYGGVTVTAIGEGACSYCNKLKKLTIPQSVKDIGIEAFAHCEGVTNVYIQANSVTNISFGAFAWNMNTMDVEVAGSVRTIGEWAFMHNFGPYNLNDDFTTGQLVLHEGIREIGRGAFERCFRIGEIEIPRSVQRMGESAFADTRLARRIVIGNGLRVIPESAFECSWGSKLSELIIGNNVVGIGACAFAGCEKLRNLNIPSAVWDIGDNAFSGCTSLCALNLPSNLKSIGAGAFGGSSYGMMMSSARSLLGIGAQTFDGCTDLRRVLVPNSVTNIGVGAFGAVTSENLGRIYLPSSLKSADDSDTLAFLADQFPGLNLGIGDVTWYDDESELNYVTVTFDPNNGGETWSEQVLDYLDALPVPVTNGYAFAGWWTTSDDSGEKITMSRHFSVDTTLYAHWIETSVTFGEDAPWTAVYDDYYGEWVLQSGDVAFGHTSSASMTVTGPCIVEFNFMNYMDEWGTSNDIELLVDGEMVEYYGIFNWKSATYEIPDAGEHTVTWRYVNLNGSFEDYARLRNFSATPAVAHTVTFNLEGGTMAEATSRQVLRSLGALPIPVKAGYIFNGWWWTDGDGFAERVSTDFVVEDDVELVARWEASPFSAVGGDASWFLDENGDYRTETIGKDKTVWAELRFKGPANISFSYKTSMSWMSDDHFEFVVDGERAVYQGGSSSWRSYSAAFSDDAEHVVRWVVRRNDYGDDDYEAENCVWLTYLNLPEAIIAVETPDQPPVVVDDTKMEEPVENGDGTRTIAAKEGETLTQSDVASVTVASPVDPAIDITAAYTKTLVDNTIVLQLAVPALEDVPELNDDDEDPSGMLDDVDDIDDGKIAAMPEPDVSDPDPEKREEVGALPIKMYPGLYYQASWGDDLNNLTSGAKFRADGSQTHIGVIKQNGSRGFYKISVSER